MENFRVLSTSQILSERKRTVLLYSLIQLDWKSDHNTPLLKIFQWLSILLKIKTKLLLSTVHKAFYDLTSATFSGMQSHVYAIFFLTFVRAASTWKAFCAWFAQLLALISLGSGLVIFSKGVLDSPKGIWCLPPPRSHNILQTALVKQSTHCLFAYPS